MSPSEAFDAYYKWLAIPPEEQPPNLYRLLAIPLFTDDADVIANAADQRMGHIRSFQTGLHSELSQKILNELSQARLCLLNAERKAAYDRDLSEQLCARQAASTLSKPSQQAIDLMAHVARPDGPQSYSPGRQIRRPRKSLQLEFAKVVAGSVMGLVLGYLILCWLAPRADFLGLFNVPNSEQVASSNGDNVKRQNPPRSNSTDSRRLPQRNNPPLKQEQVADRPPKSAAPAVSLPASELESKPGATPSPTDEKTSRLRQLLAEKELAIARNDVDAAWKSIDAIVALDGGDTPSMKLALIRQMKGSIDSSVFAERLMELVEQAVADGRKDFAFEHVDELLVAARKSENPDLVRRATLCVVNVQQLNAR